jgi:hypothetical protein
VIRQRIHTQMGDRSYSSRTFMANKHSKIMRILCWKFRIVLGIFDVREALRLTYWTSVQKAPSSILVVVTNIIKVIQNFPV